MLGAIRKNIGDDTHRRSRRVNVSSASDIFFQQIVLNCSRNLGRRHATLLGDQLVKQQQHGSRRIDRHRCRHFVKRQIGEQHTHVFDRIDRDANFANLASRTRMIAVVPHLRRQVEGARQTCLTCVQQKLKTLIRIGCRAEARILTHCPQTIAMHRWINATCIRRLARFTQTIRGVEITQRFV